MQFIDEATIRIKAGNGGNGAVSFLRTKRTQDGGPDGGCGGKGGNVIARCIGSLNTLMDYRYKRNFEAENGVNGGGTRRKMGASGKNIYLDLPVGTQIFFEDGETLFCDLIQEGDEILLAKGGNGGWGNEHFKSSTNQAPRIAYSGQYGEEFNLILKLKLLSDVGLVGLPNAGKSTFLSIVTRAKPKIADYPFTTLKPKLGVAYIDDNEFVIADLPGLIKDASEGRGLGDRFLKHIERCAILLHLIDVNSKNIIEDYQIIRTELESGKYDISHKNEIIALTKIDTMSIEEVKEIKKELENFSKKQVFIISSVSQQGTDNVLRELLNQVKEYRENNKEENNLAVNIESIKEYFKIDSSINQSEVVVEAVDLAEEADDDENEELK